MVSFYIDIIKKQAKKTHQASCLYSAPQFSHHVDLIWMSVVSIMSCKGTNVKYTTVLCFFFLFK